MLNESRLHLRSDSKAAHAGWSHHCVCQQRSHGQPGCQVPACHAHFSAGSTPADFQYIVMGHARPGACAAVPDCSRYVCHLCAPPQLQIAMLCLGKSGTCAVGGETVHNRRMLRATRAPLHAVAVLTHNVQHVTAHWLLAHQSRSCADADLCSSRSCSTWCR